ncbi:phospholipase D-like domain-containing protein [Mycolicibacterium llatzerense]|uniref:phospholipase D-like domain-containing protein n=2 Tax=Mycolicibacterium llatzerense TaxID=280871 RepID=UPI0031DE3F2A
MPTLFAALTRTAAAIAAVAAVAAGCAVPRTGALPAAAADHTGAPYQLITEPDAGYQPLYDLLGSATKSLRLSIYQMSDKVATKTLTTAAGRGVRVKVLLDAAFHGEAANQNTYAALKEGGVDVKWAPADVIYHEKSFVIDDQVAGIGTGNLMSRHYSTGRDSWVIDRVHDEVAAIAATFDADFANTAQTPPQATPASHLLWSPQARNAYTQAIDQATHTLDITSEELADRIVLASITRAARRGVPCRIVMTENPSWDRAIDEVTAAGCSVHLLPADPTALYMHLKTLRTDRQLIIGSHNLSKTSLLDNRELSLQLDDTVAPDILSATAATFDRDYQQAQPAAASTH